MNTAASPALADGGTVYINDTEGRGGSSAHISRCYYSALAAASLINTHGDYLLPRAYLNLKQSANHLIRLLLRQARYKLKLPLQLFRIDMLLTNQSI